jgi:membrane-associated phospholipid phosphatase
MMISRVSLGEHWTSDVLGGGILGLAAGVFTLIFFERDFSTSKVGRSCSK